MSITHPGTPTSMLPVHPPPLSLFPCIFHAVVDCIVATSSRLDKRGMRTQDRRYAYSPILTDGEVLGTTVSEQKYRGSQLCACCCNPMGREFLRTGVM